MKIIRSLFYMEVELTFVSLLTTLVDLELLLLPPVAELLLLLLPVVVVVVVTAVEDDCVCCWAVEMAPVTVVAVVTGTDCEPLLSVEVEEVGVVTVAAVDLLSFVKGPPPFLSCFLPPFTISASLGLPSSLTVGGGGGGGGATVSSDVGRGGKFPGAKSSFCCGRFSGLYQIKHTILIIGS